MTDKPTTTRQRRRRAALDRLAQQLGFATWGKLETAAIQKQITLTVQSTLPEKQQEHPPA